MADVLQGARELYRINKDEGDESLPFFVFSRHIFNAIFSEIFKGRQIILEPFKHLRWCVFAQTVNTLKLLTGYSKKVHLRFLKGF